MDPGQQSQSLSGRRLTEALAHGVEAANQRRELLKQVPELVSELIQAKPLVGVPKLFRFHPENKRLYFLADTKTSELLYVDLPQFDGTSNRLIKYTNQLKISFPAKMHHFRPRKKVSTTFCCSVSRLFPFGLLLRPCCFSPTTG